MASERGDIQVNMTGNQTAFQATLNKARQEVKAFAKETGEAIGESWSPKTLLAGASGFLAFEGVKSLFEGWSERVRGVRELSEELDQSADEMERLRVAGKNAGVEFQKVANILTIVQQKRLEAANDPKTRALFERLGVSNGTVLNPNVGLLGFIQAMNVGRNDAATQSILMDLVGPKNFRQLRGMAAEIPGAQGEITQEQMEMAKQLHQDTTALKEGGENIVGGIAQSFYRVFAKGDIFTPGTKDFFSRFFSGLVPRFPSQFESQSGLAGTVTGPTVTQTAAESAGESESIGSKFYLSDEELDAHARKMQELGSQNRQLERSLMTIGERRNSILEEEAKVKDEIAAIDEKSFDNAKDALKAEEDRAALQNKLLQLRRELIRAPLPWETQAATHYSDLFRGGTTFGGHNNPVVRAINDLHFTVRSQGIQ